MKKFGILLSVVCAFAAFGAACRPSDGETETYQPYTDVAGQAADAEFSFETELGEAEALYPQSTGRTFYVSAEGDDANDGLSEQAPLRSIDAVNALELRPGDSVRFRGGDTFEGSISMSGLKGEADNPITFCGYDDEQEPAHIKGGANAVRFTFASNVVVRDLKIEGSSPDYGQPGAAGGDVLSFNYNATEERFENIYIVNNEVFSNSYENRLFGISINLSADRETDIPERVLSHVVISGNTVHTTGRTGIHSGGWFAQETGNQNACRVTDFYDISVDGNHVYDMGHIGIYLGGVTNSRITRNLVHDTGLYSTAALLEGECGIMAISADTMDIMYNVTYNNFDASMNYDSMGIDIDWNTNNINVQYNHTYDCLGSGIATMANQNSFIRNNRVENNRCATNCNSQIQVGNFTVESQYIGEDMHGVTNLTVADNLIVGEDTYMFRAMVSNGSLAWKGNSFENNRVVNNSETDAQYWIFVDDDVGWNTFAGNRYYTENTSFKFRAYDNTSGALIEGDGQQYLYDGTFEAWQKRDTGASIGKRSDTPPGAVTGADVKFENGSLVFSWAGAAGDVWHYNVHMTAFDEKVSYLNMLGETSGTSYTFTPPAAGEYYFVIQPESNQGVYGKAVKLRVTLG